MGHRDHAARRNGDALAGRSLPDDLAIDGSRAPVERPPELEQIGLVDLQRLVVDIEPDDLGVGGCSPSAQVGQNRMIEEERILGSS
jgi:hypothetical protein